MKSRPYGARIVVQVLKPPDRSAGGILIPESAEKTTVRGRVLAVGPGGRDQNGKLHPLQVHEGQVVVFAEFSGLVYDKNGNDRTMILGENEILVVEDKP